MELQDAATFAILLFLLPGLIGLLVFERIAEISRTRTAFDKIVVGAALAITSTAITNWVLSIFGAPLIQGVAAPENGAAMSLMIVDNVAGWPLAANAAAAVILAGLAAGLHNSGWLFAVLRWARLTNNTGRIDIWHDVFSTYRGSWVRVKFKDGLELVGWPEYYSTMPGQRELFMADATWVEPVGGSRANVPGPGVYVNNVTEIESIEFFE